MQVRQMWKVGVGLMAVAMMTMATTACSSSSSLGDKPEVDWPEDVPSMHIEPQRGVYVRAGFDADPSHFIGQFINDDVPADEIDETRGVQTQCSQYIEYQEVRAGGTYDEVFKASRSAGASLGVQPVAELDDVSGGISGGMEEGAVVRVEYELTKQMRGVQTPEYYECCRQNVGGCSGRYLSEFWAGTGRIYQLVGSQRGFQAGGSIPGSGDAAIEFQNGAAWSRAMEFDDLYFAFRITDAQIQDDCGWVDQVPTADDGQYFVGVSPPVATESMARDRAMRNARTQAVQYLGEEIRLEATTEMHALEGYMEDEEVVNVMAEGLAERVQSDRFCAVETVDSPEGQLYISRVLAFFPETEMQAATDESMEALEDQLERDGELSEEEREAIERIRRNVGR